MPNVTIYTYTIGGQIVSTHTLLGAPGAFAIEYVDPITGETIVNCGHRTVADAESFLSSICPQAKDAKLVATPA